jgi:hypothetical protein
VRTNWLIEDLRVKAFGGAPARPIVPIHRLDDIPFLVTGIIDDASDDARVATTAVVPMRVATKYWPNRGTVELLVRTETGAAKTVAAQLAPTIDPYHPNAFKVVAPPEPKQALVTHPWVPD